MEIITKSTLANADSPLPLTHKTLYLLDDDVIDPRAIKDVAKLIDLLDGSRVELTLVHSSVNDKVLLMLRCGAHESTMLDERYLSDVIALAPFIAACAGMAESTGMSPEDLQDLDERLVRLSNLKDELNELEQHLDGLRDADGKLPDLGELSERVKKLEGLVGLAAADDGSPST